MLYTKLIHLGGSVHCTEELALISRAMLVAGGFTSFCERPPYRIGSKPEARGLSYNMLKKRMSPTGDPNYKFPSSTTLLFAAEASKRFFSHQYHSLLSDILSHFKVQ